MLPSHWRAPGVTASLLLPADGVVWMRRRSHSAVSEHDARSRARARPVGESDAVTQPSLAGRRMRPAVWQILIDGWLVVTHHPLVMKGVSQGVSEILAHSNIQVTGDVYGHVALAVSADASVRVPTQCSSNRSSDTPTHPRLSARTPSRSRSDSTQLLTSPRPMSPSGASESNDKGPPSRIYPGRWPLSVGLTGFEPATP